MQFSDTTNKNGIIQRVEDYANFSDGAISGDSTLLKKFTVHVNETINDLMLEILKVQDEFEWDDLNASTHPIATTPLVAGQRDYAISNISFLKLHRVDISYNGTTYYRASAFDSKSHEEGLGNDSKTDEQFLKTAPYYDVLGKALFIYPRADAIDVANGGEIRIEYARSFDGFSSTDTTETPPIDSPFHDLIAIGAALKWNLIKSGKNASNLASMYAAGLERMRNYYATRNEDADLSFRFNLIENYE